jgi:hypothetical protein
MEDSEAMQEVSQRIKRLVREWAGIGHDRDLRKALSELACNSIAGIVAKLSRSSSTTLCIDSMRDTALSVRRFAVRLKADTTDDQKTGRPAEAGRYVQIGLLCVLGVLCVDRRTRDRSVTASRD